MSLLKRLGRSLLLGLLPVLATGCFTATSPGLADTDGEKLEPAKCLTPQDHVKSAERVVELLNLERAEAGLPPVRINSTLTDMAGDFSCRMIEVGFFAHTDPETGAGPGSRAVDAKYAFFSVGENLAAGQETAAEVVKVWMESDAHRHIVLDAKWREVGVAVREGGEYGTYWVLEFGDPAEF